MNITIKNKRESSLSSMLNNVHSFVLDTEGVRVYGKTSGGKLEITKQTERGISTTESDNTSLTFSGFTRLDVLFVDSQSINLYFNLNEGLMDVSCS